MFNWKEWIFIYVFMKQTSYKTTHRRKERSLHEHNDKKVPGYTLEYVFHRIDIDFVNANQM
jgi:hypothetical protein